MKIYQPSKDETAFLYQQAFELEPFVKDLGSLTVLVEEMELAEDNNDDELETDDGFEYTLQEVNSEVKATDELDKHQFAVTFVVAPESMQFKVRGRGNSLIEATIAAKDEARRQLNSLVNSLPVDQNGSPQWLH